MGYPEHVRGVGTTQDAAASYTSRVCEQKLPESLLQRTPPLLKVAVNQNTPALDADVSCIIILLTLQKPAPNGLLHLPRSKSHPAPSLQLMHNKLHDLTD